MASVRQMSCHVMLKPLLLIWTIPRWRLSWVRWPFLSCCVCRVRCVKIRSHESQRLSQIHPLSIPVTVSHCYFSSCVSRIITCSAASVCNRWFTCHLCSEVFPTSLVLEEAKKGKNRRAVRVFFRRACEAVKQLFPCCDPDRVQPPKADPDPDRSQLFLPEQDLGPDSQNILKKRFLLNCHFPLIF